MHGIVCVDDRMGMLFNHRRQSQDRILREYLLNLTNGKKLLMNSYSAGQFRETPGIHVSETFLQDASGDDFCFVEDQHLVPWLAELNSLILCRWNREYPGDFFLDLDLKDWNLQHSEEISGSSHDKITIEVYVK